MAKLKPKSEYEYLWQVIAPTGEIVTGWRSKNVALMDANSIGGSVKRFKHLRSTTPPDWYFGNTYDWKKAHGQWPG